MTTILLTLPQLRSLASGQSVDTAGGRIEARCLDARQLARIEAGDQIHIGQMRLVRRPADFARAARMTIAGESVIVRRAPSGFNVWVGSAPHLLNTCPLPDMPDQDMVEEMLGMNCGVAA